MCSQIEGLVTYSLLYLSIGVCEHKPEATPGQRRAHQKELEHWESAGAPPSLDGILARLSREAGGITREPQELLRSPQQCRENLGGGGNEGISSMAGLPKAPLVDLTSCLFLVSSCPLYGAAAGGSGGLGGGINKPGQHTYTNETLPVKTY